MSSRLAPPHARHLSLCALRLAMPTIVPRMLPRAVPHRAPLSSATPPAGEARLEILRILRALDASKDACCETFEPRMAEEGVLVLDLGEKGQYSLQEAGSAQLLLFSPVSGPLYYQYDAENEWWKNPNDGHLLVELLVRELMHSTSVYINL
ncbi:hypothetical protein AB1Y20_019634 [Prymnesium parvum]|uniref:Frataxin n=1 Tax=Prymnesium parvum TaxID=97485 RepID=A0AB34JRN7_PRYPA